MNQRANEPTQRWIGLLIVALAVWGLYHAVGAYFFNHDIRRGLVVLACMALFVAFWLALLRFRAKRPRRFDSNINEEAT